MTISTFIETTTKEAGKLAKERFGKDGVLRTKSGKTDYVTKSDLLVHERITQQLLEQFPNDTIISEEDEQNHHLITDGGMMNGTYWVLDPIDGTNNFATGIPLFGTMLCRMENGLTTHTGIYLPMQDAYYEAEQGKGAFVNKEAIQCSTEPQWQETFGCTNANLSEKKLPLRNALSKAWSESKFWLSAYGSAAVSGVFVASGKRDWYMTMGSRVWDYAPLTLLLKEAGCTVTNFSGSNWKPGDRSMIAANPNLHSSLIALLDN